MDKPANIDKILGSLRSSDGFSSLDTSITEAALQSIRSEFESSSDPIDRYRAICAQIGAADHLEWRRILINLREEFVTQALAATIDEIGQKFKQSPEQGWELWMKELLGALLFFPQYYSIKLCEHDFPFDREHEQAIRKTRKAVLYMCQSRWEIAQPEIDFLSKQESLPALSRARLISLSGQIHLLRFYNATQARVLLEQAEKLAPNDSGVLAAFGDYWLYKEDLKEAENYYGRAINAAPKMASGYVGMGDLFEKNNQLETAELWYREAVSKAGGSSLGYDRLLRILGRPANFKSREQEFLAILDKRIAVDPDGMYNLHLEIGKYYLENQRYTEATERYDEAIKLNESHPGAYIEKADLSRLQGNYREAEEFGTKAIERSDKVELGAQYVLEAIADDYYKKCADKESAKRVYGKVLGFLGEQYKGSFHNRLGNMYYYLGEYESAVEEYRKAIKVAPGEPVFHRNLSGAFQYLKDYETAIRELECAYAIDNDKKLFDQKKANLANLQGNEAYERKNYEEAIKHYSEARELDPSQAVYETNLAGAWLLLKEPGKRAYALDQAIQCYDRAQGIDPKEEHLEQIARLKRQREITQEYGEKALDRLNVVTPVAIEVAGDLIQYVEGIERDTLSEELAENVSRLRVRVLEQFGVKLPGFRFRGNETDLADGTYIIFIKEIPVVSGNLSTRRRFCNISEKDLSEIGVTGDPGADPVTGEDGFWIDRDDWEKVESIQPQKAELCGLTQYLMRHVEAVLRRNLGEFLGPQEIVNLLKADSGEPFEEILASPKMVTALSTVCRALVAEEVPILPFQDLCTTFRDLYSNCVGQRDIVERIRCLPAFREHLPGNDGRCSFLKLSASFESEIRRSLYKQEGHWILAMEPERCQEALTAVRNEVTNGPFALVVSDVTLRPFVRKLVELEFPALHVLSRAELRDETKLAQAVLIDLGSEPAMSPFQFQSPCQVDAAAADQGKNRRCPAPALRDICVEVFVSEDFEIHPSVADDKPMSEMFSMMQDGLHYDLGIILPEAQLHTDRNLKTNEFRIRINGVERQPVTGLGHDDFLVNDTVDRLKLFNIEGRTAINPANGSE